MTLTAEVPWYQPLDPSFFSFSQFRLTAIGRALTTLLVSLLPALLHVVQYSTVLYSVSFHFCRSLLPALLLQTRSVAAVPCRRITRLMDGECVSGRWCLEAVLHVVRAMQVQVLEKVKLAPEGSVKVQKFLEKGADGLVKGGR